MWMDVDGCGWMWMVVGAIFKVVTRRWIGLDNSAYGIFTNFATITPMRIILGIGNPGQQYEKTRHNCGFMVLDALAKRVQLTTWSKRFQSLVCDTKTNDHTQHILLLKPQTFVNHSGAALMAAMAFYKVPPSDVLIVVDDIHLPLGHLRLRPEGSAGGHNGLRDIERCIGSAYARLRMGISQANSAASQIDFVLGAFTADEQPELALMIDKAVTCVEEWVIHGQGVACRFNGPSKPVAPKASLPKPAKATAAETSNAPIVTPDNRLPEQ
jgi:peptidyl-tRNA hydrolase, PTH1 family